MGKHFTTIDSMAEFYVGQRVRMTEKGKIALGKRYRRYKIVEATVTAIHDLSYCIRQDAPGYKRDFALQVHIDGSMTKFALGGNAIYWEPVKASERLKAA